MQGITKLHSKIGDFRRNDYKLDLFLAPDNPRYFRINLRQRKTKYTFDIFVGVRDLWRLNSSYRFTSSCELC